MSKTATIVLILIIAATSLMMAESTFAQSMATVKIQETQNQLSTEQSGVPKLVTLLSATFTTSIIRTEKGAINFLHIQGAVINEGTSTAYNCDLKVTSHTNSGTIYTDYYTFNALVPGANLYVDTNIFHDNLTSWEIIPECTQRPLWLPGIILTSPSNNTYSSNLLTLNVSTKTQQGIDVVISMNYSIDGKNEGTIPTTTKIEPINSTFTDATGAVIYVPSIQFPMVTEGNVTLPNLSEGIHDVTVYAKYDYPSYVAPPLIFTSYENSTVNFTIDLNPNTAPAISILTIENKIYTSNTIPLNFSSSKAWSKISYSLNNKANITIAENTTLTGLTDGSYSLVIYANDTAGNTGKSETIFFTINTQPPSSSSTEKPTLEPATISQPLQIGNFELIIIVVLIFALVVVSGLLVYYHKRGPKRE
jgi:hypothetical protein